MLIGIVAQKHLDILGVHEDYLHLVEEFGTPFPIPPLDRESFMNVMRGLGGLVIPGGADVDPRRYSILPSIFAGSPNPYLEHFDTEILPHVIGRIPIFGICRGLQTLNVVLGGTLQQHLRTHPHSNGKTDLVHKIFIGGAGEGIPVNSFHHQSIGRLSKDLKAIAVAGDGVIEAVQNERKMVAAVQYHPERLWDDFALQLMRGLFK